MGQVQKDRDREQDVVEEDLAVGDEDAWAAIEPAPEPAENVCVLRVARPFLIK